MNESSCLSLVSSRKAAMNRAGVSKILLHREPRSYPLSFSAQFSDWQLEFVMLMYLRDTSDVFEDLNVMLSSLTSLKLT